MVVIVVADAVAAGCHVVSEVDLYVLVECAALSIIASWFCCGASLPLTPLP